MRFISTVSRTLRGRDGDPGQPGPPGQPGQPGSAGATMLGTATLTETAVIALTAGVRKVTVTAPGTVVGNNYIVIPTASLPNGYALLNAICLTAGQLQISIIAPLLAIGQSYSIPIRVVRINA